MNKDNNERLIQMENSEYTPFGKYIGDFSFFAKNKNNDPDFVLPGILRKTVSFLNGTGGTGKSKLAIQLALSKAVGGNKRKIPTEKPNWHIFDEGGPLAFRKEFDELGGKKDNNSFIRYKSGKVAYFFFEDTKDILHKSFYTFAKHYMTPAEIEMASKNFVPIFLSSEGYSLVRRLNDNKLSLTDEKYSHSHRTNDDNLIIPEFIRLNSLFKKEEKFDLIVIDTLSRATSSAGVDENSQHEMAKIIGDLIKFAKDTNTAILILHHTNKNAQRNNIGENNATRGSSVIVDNSRFSMILRNMTEKEAEYFVKEEYSIDFADKITKKFTLDDKRFYTYVSFQKSNFVMPPPTTIIFKSTGGFFVKSNLKKNPPESKIIAKVTNDSKEQEQNTEKPEEKSINIKKSRN